MAWAGAGLREDGEALRVASHVPSALAPGPSEELLLIRQNPAPVTFPVIFNTCSLFFSPLLKTVFILLLICLGSESLDFQVFFFFFLDFKLFI